MSFTAQVCRWLEPWAIVTSVARLIGCWPMQTLAVVPAVYQWQVITDPRLTLAAGGHG